MTKWRVGRKVGRTIYQQFGQAPSDSDPLIGVMDTPELARLAAAAPTMYANLEGIGHCLRSYIDRREDSGADLAGCLALALEAIRAARGKARESEDGGQPRA